MCVKYRMALPIFLAVAAVVPVLAHHGAAAYDNAKSLSIKGIVTEYDFVNPHVEIFIDAKNANGEIEKWQGELNSPNLLSHRGWSRATIKPGQEVTLVGYPAKSGAKSLRLQKVLGPDGKALGEDSGTE
jgi:Family of unknown function (DUF6152)